jgi:hypothetical protein
MYGDGRRLEGGDGPMGNRGRGGSHEQAIAPLTMELTLGSETSAFKIQTLGNNPEDFILQCMFVFLRVKVMSTVTRLFFKLKVF